MISPQNLAVGTSATGLQGREGDLLRLVLKWSIGLTIVMSILVALQAYVLPFMIPGVGGVRTLRELRYCEASRIVT